MKGLNVSSDQPQVSAQKPRPREYEATLPIGYTDAEGKIHRNVVLRKMTGHEEAIIADRRYQRNGGKLLTELLTGCIVRLGDLGAPPRSAVSSMYSVDRNYLLVRLRSITFGSELPVTYSCPGCGESIQLTEDLDSLPVESLLDGETVDEVLVELEDGYLDRDGQVHTALRLRLPLGTDEEAVAGQMRDNPSLGKNALLARCVQSLGDLPRPRLEALGPKIMGELTMTDRRLIDRALEDGARGIDLVRQQECPRCGKGFSASLDMSNFFALA
jgi:ribosomal protein S27AE